MPADAGCYGPYDAYCDGAISGAVRGYLNSGVRP